MKIANGLLKPVTTVTTTTTSPNLVEYKQIPMVCLAIRGDLKSIEAIEMKIRKEIPVMILKGSGAVCDIIAFAYEEISEKCELSLLYLIIDILIF